MFADFFCIFTSGGLVLWYKDFVGEAKFDILNLFVKNIILEEKTHQPSYSIQEYLIKWRIVNELGIYFVVRRPPVEANPRLPLR